MHITHKKFSHLFAVKGTSKFVAGDAKMKRLKRRERKGGERLSVFGKLLL